MIESQRPRFQLISQREMYQKVVLDGILKARRRVSIATATIKNLYVEGTTGYVSILKGFERLCLEGVEVRILHSGVPSGPFLEEIKDSLLIEMKGFTMRLCPRVHFKIAVIDEEWAYLGSANLTGAGIGAKGEHKRNFENGIITRDADTVDYMLDQFNHIWHGRECEPCERREHCPVPLEEISALHTKPAADAPSGDAPAPKARSPRRTARAAKRRASTRKKSPRPKRGKD